MLDAIATLLLEENELKQSDKDSFSFSWLAQQVLRRQAVRKDCIIIISGDRRQGKSNWGLKLIRAYIRLRRAQDPNFTWSWKKNFPLSRTSAMKMAETLPQKNFIFYDEGGDQFYRQETNKRSQRELVKFLNKSGMKMHLTIIVWPDVYTLDPKIVNMAQLLVIVPYRAEAMIPCRSGSATTYKPESICSFAFVYGRSNNPFNYDKFGIEKIRKKLTGPKAGVRSMLPTMNGEMTVDHEGERVKIRYPLELFKFLRSMPTFCMMHKFQPVNKRFEDVYIKNVKDLQLKANREDDYISQAEYERLRVQYRTLLYNLYTRDDKSLAQLERLHIDTKGNHVRSVSGIKHDIDSMKAMQ